MIKSQTKYTKKTAPIGAVFPLNVINELFCNNYFLSR